MRRGRTAANFKLQEIAHRVSKRVGAGAAERRIIFPDFMQIIRIFRIFRATLCFSSKGSSLKADIGETVATTADDVAGASAFKGSSPNGRVNENVKNLNRTF